MIDEYSGLVSIIVQNHLNSNFSQEDIEECVSDIFIVAYNNIDKFDIRKGTIKGFLATISKRKAIDIYRKNKQVNNLAFNEDILQTNYDDISSHLYIKERNKILINAIENLDEPDKTIIIRKYLLKDSSKSISNALNIKINTIDKRASRALVKLKNILGGNI